MLLQNVFSATAAIGPLKDHLKHEVHRYSPVQISNSLSAKLLNYFFYQFKHVFCVPKRAVSFRQFFLVPTLYVLIEK